MNIIVLSNSGRAGASSPKPRLQIHRRAESLPGFAETNDDNDDELPPVADTRTVPRRLPKRKLIRVSDGANKKTVIDERKIKHNLAEGSRRTVMKEALHELFAQVTKSLTRVLSLDFLDSLDFLFSLKIRLLDFFIFCSSIHASRERSGQN